MDSFDNNKARLLGEALLDVVLRWPEWVHRRVDSLHPLEGEWGRRRHSIDCQPPLDPRLIYIVDGSEPASTSGSSSLSMVPLLYVEKGPLRNFDIEDTSGNTMPVLGTEETTQAGVVMMKHLFTMNSIIQTSELSDALAEIAGPDVRSSTHSDELDLFVSSGIWNGKLCFQADDSSLDKLVEYMIRTFADKFLLISLMPTSSMKVRQILKISYHWNVVEDFPKISLWQRLLIASGAKALSLSFAMDGSSYTRSYHLEFHTPTEVECLLLRIPNAGLLVPGTASTPDIHEDNSRIPVAHVHGGFVGYSTDTRAELVLGIPKRGVQNTALFASTFSLFLILLVLVLPDATEVWRRTPGNAATALLTAPAVLIAFLASQGESALMKKPLDLLRFFISSSGCSLFLIAASLIGELRDPWLVPFWSLIAIWNGAIAMVLAGARLNRRFIRIARHASGNPSLDIIVPTYPATAGMK